MKSLEDDSITNFATVLIKKQVFAVLEEDSDSKRPIKIEDPEGVLKEVYGTLHKSKKYEFADDIQKRMRIIIVGGDDVVNWIL
ncbi:diacylglycerol kinase 5-like [Malus sylvestris]|uniref:diacylglycerol kinase 5-like n=1 Tax=Malus sylvestris TaxID=3752 RepID=UPI0021ABFBE8|nr:diacylglycerol kinase 5-like [Malus sylvestris]